MLYGVREQVWWRESAEHGVNIKNIGGYSVFHPIHYMCLSLLYNVKKHLGMWLTVCRESYNNYSVLEGDYEFEM